MNRNGGSTRQPTRYWVEWCISERRTEFADVTGLTAARRLADRRRGEVWEQVNLHQSQSDEFGNPTWEWDDERVVYHA